MFLGALATPRRYLSDVATWLCAQGYGVLTFDYRGVGGSSHSSDPTTNLDHWGHDVEAAIAAARDAFAPRSLIAVGHSLGGMLLGHSGAGAVVDAALLIGATHGLPRYYSGAARLRVEAAYLVLPRVARALGGLPSFFLTERVPRDVIVHWTRWGRGSRFVRWNGEPSDERFGDLRGPLVGVAVADDSYAPCAAVDALLELYTGAGVRRVVVDPRQYGGPALGHFGLLGPKAPTWARGLLARWLRDLEEASA